MAKQLKEVFKVNKPLIAMLHLKGDSDQEILERAIREIDIYERSGVDAIVVENYFGNYYNMREVLAYLKENKSEMVYGVNSLNFDSLGFDLANEFGAKFLQLDSVVGHVKPRDEASMEAFLEQQRNNCDAFLLGGVRFKYQPVLSEKSVEEDLEISKSRCDGVVVTGNATGEQTDLEKIKLFRNTLGEFPLIIGAGITKENVREQLQYADGIIVGSYLKDNRKDFGEVSEEHVRELVEVIEEIRREEN